MSTALNRFHPAVQGWFRSCFETPSAVQEQAWDALFQYRSLLLSAPTGTGKTLAAFLKAINDLILEGLAGAQEKRIRILYVSPLKALSNDVHKNLSVPLMGIRDKLLESGLPDVDIRSMVRTGDTSSTERARMIRTPPDILVTTPESLYILLTSESGRRLLGHVETVIIDELHAVMENKRGSHLALSLQRLKSLGPQPPTLIGISATQNPITRVRDYFFTQAEQPVHMVDVGFSRTMDLEIVLPDSPLESVTSATVWSEIYDQLSTLIEAHHTTLIFTNTRRMTERICAALEDRLGSGQVAPHHGSLSKEQRLDAEQKLKQGKLRAMVATASLELGIDIGEVNLVCQIGSPRSIATLLQRIGRSGHSVGLVPKGRLFPTSLHELLDVVALTSAIRQGVLDKLVACEGALDVLAQQLVAELSCREWDLDELYEAVAQTWPYRNLTRGKYQQVLEMLTSGYHTRRGRRSAYLHLDKVHNRTRGRKGARTTALMNAGAIPDHFDYDVILQPDAVFIGTLNEDFAFESLPGDIFQLGNNSYRMLKIERGKVYVEDASGMPPGIPFWFGDAASRSRELSDRVLQILDAYSDPSTASDAPAEELLAGIPDPARQALTDYLLKSRALLGTLPGPDRIVFERFLDENGDMHLVIHSPHGSRINRAWGLALRKRFCRKFNFELQAAATENCIILSLGPTHSFPLEEVASYLKSSTVRDILRQAVLASPAFATRWRWVANISLAVPRMRAGKRVPAAFQRNDSEDLISVVFPDQLACQENITGDREIPDHPLVDETMRDCLNDFMDIDGLVELLRRMESGAIRFHCVDTTTPSPLAMEVVNARPFAFLDDGAAEERRTLAIQPHSFTDVREAAANNKVYPAVLREIQEAILGRIRNPEELHEFLVGIGCLTETEAGNALRYAVSAYTRDTHWGPWLQTLSHRQSVYRVTVGSSRLWTAVERLHEVLALNPECITEPALPADLELPRPEREDALRELIRSRLEYHSPIREAQLRDLFPVSENEILAALYHLEQEGFAIRTTLGLADEPGLWCSRYFYSQAHKRSLENRRRQNRPVSVRTYYRFLLEHHGLYDKFSGQDGLRKVLERLEGFPIRPGELETVILPCRFDRYVSSDIDYALGSGSFCWMRVITDRNREQVYRNNTLKNTPIYLLDRSRQQDWLFWNPNPIDRKSLGEPARLVLELLEQRGALFFIDLVQQTGMLRTQVENALFELAVNGFITSDTYNGIRAFEKSGQRGRARLRLAGRQSYHVIDKAGRWSRIQYPAQAESDPETRLAHLGAILRVLLNRYGVLCKTLLAQETLLPPWRDLLYCLRRMEAREEILAGRFIDGLPGEQFTSRDVYTRLQTVEKQPDDTREVIISANDPLNLAASLFSIALPTSAGPQKLLIRNGLPIAAHSDQEVIFLAPLSEAEKMQASIKLLSHANPRFHPDPATNIPPQ